MTTKPHDQPGRAFEETFTVTVRGAVHGQPCGWGCSSHETKWLEDSLRAAVADAIARYYQCDLSQVSLTVELHT